MCEIIARDAAQRDVEAQQPKWLTVVADEVAPPTPPAIPAPPLPPLPCAATAPPPPPRPPSIPTPCAAPGALYAQPARALGAAHGAARHALGAQHPPNPPCTCDLGLFCTHTVAAFVTYGCRRAPSWPLARRTTTACRRTRANRTTRLRTAATCRAATRLHLGHRARSHTQLRPQLDPDPT